MPKKSIFKRLSFSTYKNLLAHLVLFLVAVVIAAFLYGSINTWTRKIVDKGVLLVTGKPLNYTIDVDENGVPYMNEVKVGRQRNPVTICNTALNYYEEIKKGDHTHQQFFLNCANWLVEHRTYRNDTATVLEYRYNWDVYHMTNPWQSGMAQGLSLQVLVGAHQITKEEKYLKAAREQLNSFYIDINDNGITRKSADHGWWYEEFADKNGKESRVLNGMIFAVLGIYDYYEYTHSASAKFLFEQGTKAVKLDVALYDKDGFSYYDRLGTDNLKYHWIHVDLLQKMYKASGEPIFKKYADHWGNYTDPSFVVKVFKGNAKPIHAAIFLVNAFLLFVLFELVFIFYLVFKKISRRKTAN